MMEMDDRGSAKCQKSKSEDMIGIIEFDLMIIGQNSEQLSSSFKQKTKTWKNGEKDPIAFRLCF